MAGVKGTASARRNLLVFGSALPLLNIVAALVAVAVNWPSQFGGVGTDAGDELVTRGTAISAPILPVAVLVASLLLIRRGGRLFIPGIIGVALTAALFLVGAVGELTAEATRDTPKVVLVVAGVAWILVGTTLLALAAAALVERGRARALPGSAGA